MKPLFITGIGTGIGKTLVSAIVVEALEANYWKPIQAGFTDGTDTTTVQDLISNKNTAVYKEVYKLKLPASPHIAAREENIRIDMEKICDFYLQFAIRNSQPAIHHSPFIVTEGAGGLLVPLNETEFVIDLIKRLNAKLILVSRNYLGSINHSLLTASVCKANNFDVAGWIFNDQYMNYEEEIVKWSGYPKIASVPFANVIDKGFVKEQANRIRASLLKIL